MGRTRHTRKRHTRRKHKRKRTRRRRRTRRRTRGGGIVLSPSPQIFGGGYKEGLVSFSSGSFVPAGGAKSYGISDYPPGFSKFIRRDKRIVDKMKRKTKKHKRKRKSHKHKRKRRKH